MTDQTPAPLDVTPLTAKDPARVFGYWFAAQPHSIQRALVHGWLDRHEPALNAARAGSALSAAARLVCGLLDAHWDHEDAMEFGGPLDLAHNALHAALRAALDKEPK